MAPWSAKNPSQDKTLQKFGGCPNSQSQVWTNLMLKITTLLLKKHILPNLAGKAEQIYEMTYPDWNFTPITMP